MRDHDVAGWFMASVPIAIALNRSIRVGYAGTPASRAAHSRRFFV